MGMHVQQHTGRNNRTAALEGGSMIEARVLWVIHPPNNAVIFRNNALDMYPKPILLNKFQLNANSKTFSEKIL